MASSTPSAAALQRNVRLYPWYAALLNAYFWLPVFFLYFNHRLPLEEVLRLEAIYYIAVVIFEVPSGYFSDTAGRRVTLLISAGAFISAYGFFLFGSTFAVYTVAQILLAIGISFNSGTDTSFHYDSLAALKREGEFPQREALAARNTFLSGAVAALLGGTVAGVFGLRWAYGLSAVTALATLGIVLAFTEPRAASLSKVVGSGAAEGFLRQIRSCAQYLRQPALLWLFSFSVLMVVLNHIPYEFYQPYLDLLAKDLALPGEGTPLATGIHTALTMLVGSWVAGRSVRLAQRIGTAPTLLLSTLLQTVIIGWMGLVLHPVLVVLILLRSAPRALLAAPSNAAIAPRVEQDHRATYFSLQSLVGRLSFSGSLILLSLVVGAEAATEWLQLSSVLRISTVMALVGLIALGATAKRAFADRPK